MVTAFVLLLLGVLQFALLFLSRSVMHNVMADLATGEAAGALRAADRPATVRYICDRLILSPDCGSRLSLEMAELATTEPNSMSSRFVAAPAASLMVVRAEAPVAVFVPLFRPLTVRGKAVFLRP